MTRLAKAFETPAFVGYLTAGQGGEERTVAAALAMVKGGVDVLELGVPFSEASAEGPVIQQAMREALEAGCSLEMIVRIARSIRKKSKVPIVLMGYYNPFLAGGEAFYKQAAAAGVDGMLIVDLPPEHAQEHVALCKKFGIAEIYLASPSTPAERLKMIAEQCTGFLYYVCQKGTTGVRRGLPEEFDQKIAQIGQIAKTPVVVGFGISNRATAAKVLKYADGFVVGSAFVDLLNKKKPLKDLCTLAQRLDPRSFK